MNSNIKNKIESALGEKIKDHHSVGGGCISDAQIAETFSGKKYFIKTNLHHPKDMFIKEANGLKELAKPNCIRVPLVVLAEEDFIVIENIEQSTKQKKFYEDFGRKFAQMHKHTANHFGFYENNYIGSNPQINIAEEDEKNDWKSFYFNKRILFQLKLAEKNGYATDELRKKISVLGKKVYEILSGSEEEPVLLHGDLWGGNYIVDENGQACLIDPAVYYGNREADLAMTKLFGGFSNSFYKAYNETYPLEPGYEDRENLYKLYHVLNHLNLFGGGYYQQAVSLINYYI